MTNDPDSLKIVIGLAKENGRAEQQNEFLIKELEEVKSRLEMPLGQESDIRYMRSDG